MVAAGIDFGVLHGWLVLVASCMPYQIRVPNLELEVVEQDGVSLQSPRLGVFRHKSQIGVDGVEDFIHVDEGWEADSLEPTALARQSHCLKERCNSAGVSQKAEVCDSFIRCLRKNGDLNDCSWEGLSVLPAFCLLVCVGQGEAIRGYCECLTFLMGHLLLFDAAVCHF